jgi:hypothetical protein
MGPTVWELEGPIPILNISNTLIDTIITSKFFVSFVLREFV